MKKLLFALITTLGISQAAFADCWMQCIKSPFGGCMGKVKMCNVTDADRALESLTKDIGGAYENIRNEWISIYGRLPDEVQVFLERYPLTLATLIIPGTREYALFTLALDNYVAKAKSRAKDVEVISQGQPDWKAKILKDGYTFILFLEGVDLTNYDYTSGSAPEDAKFTAVWDEFLGCVQGANALEAGKLCLSTLKVNASVL